MIAQQSDEQLLVAVAVVLLERWVVVVYTRPSVDVATIVSGYSERVPVDINALIC